MSNVFSVDKIESLEKLVEVAAHQGFGVGGVFAKVLQKRNAYDPEEEKR